MNLLVTYCLYCCQSVNILISQNHYLQTKNFGSRYINKILNYNISSPEEVTFVYKREITKWYFFLFRSPIYSEFWNSSRASFSGCETRIEGKVRISNTLLHSTLHNKNILSRFAWSAETGNCEQMLVPGNGCSVGKTNDSLHIRKPFHEASSFIAKTMKCAFPTRTFFSGSRADCDCLGGFNK